MTNTQPHESTTCNRDAGRACAMCRWANMYRGLTECPGCFEWFATGAAHVCGVSAKQVETDVSSKDATDNLIPLPNFESAWATAPREYSRYTEESHALYWYLRGMQDEQRITRLARRTLAREDVAEMGRLAQVRREG